MDLRDSGTRLLVVWGMVALVALPAVAVGYAAPSLHAPPMLTARVVTAPRGSVVPLAPLAAGSWGWFNESARYPVVPSQRSFGGMSEDPANGDSVLYGGVQISSATYLNDNWTFTQLGGWTSHPSANGPQLGRWGQMMSYDPADSLVMMYSGCTTGNGCPYQGYWDLLPGGTWQANGPSPQPWTFIGGLAAEPPLGNLVLFGGCVTWATGTCSTYNTQTWNYSKGTWTQYPGTAVNPGSRDMFGMVSDPALNRIVLYGGVQGTQFYGDTWEFSGGAWTNVTSALTGPTPGPRAGSSMSYDVQCGCVILFGGYSGTGVYNDTWAFTGTGWVNLSTPRAPSPRFGAMISDPSEGNVVLFGGATSRTGPGQNDTWLLDGPMGTGLSANRTLRDANQGLTFTATVTGGDTPYALSYAGLPPGCATANSSTLACTPTVPGTYNVTVTAVDRLGLSNTSAAVMITVLPDPAITSFTASPAIIPIGGTSDLNVSVQGGLTPYHYVYTALPPGCATIDGASWACTPTQVGTYPNITVTVTDSLSFSVSNASVTLQVVDQGPLVSAFTVAPATITLGATASFSVTASGGVGSYSFVYQNLPAGCVTSNASSLPCTPTAAGNYTNITVVVSDSLGAATTSAPVTLTVLPPPTAPTIVAFTASPSLIPLGGSTYLNVTASGGQGPYTYVYLNLPAGCGSSNTSSLACSPLAPGSYLTVAVRVIGSNSLSNTSGPTAPFNVVLPPSVSLVATPLSIVLGNSTVLNATVTGGTAPFTYVYANLPTGCISSNLSSLPCVPTQIGLYASITVSVTDANGWGATSPVVAVNVTAPIGPLQVTAFTVSPSRLLLGGSTYLNVTVSGGTSPYQYVFLGLPAGCLSSSVRSLLCTPSVAGNYSLSVTVSDSGGRSATAGPVALEVMAPSGYPSLTLVVSPSTIGLGSTTLLEADVSGGTSPYTYSYSSLPAGCTSANTSQLPCKPTSTGNFTVAASVTDAAGHAVGASALLTVVRGSSPVPLTIKGFTVTPNPSALGTTVTFAVSVTGGVAPYAYAYSGLPAGCSTINDPALICTPTQAGNVTVSVTVSDATHAMTRGIVVLEVTAPAQGNTASPSSVVGSLGFYLLLALLVAIVALVGVWLVERRRRSSRGEGAGTLAAAPAAAAATDAPTAGAAEAPPASAEWDESEGEDADAGPATETPPPKAPPSEEWSEEGPAEGPGRPPSGT